jgi:hypothetical protein
MQPSVLNDSPTTNSSRRDIITLVFKKEDQSIPLFRG